MIRLFHRTTLEAARTIPSEGFRDGKDGAVWFSEYLDCWGEQGRHLLMVMTDLTREELGTFAQEAEAGEVWDDRAGDFVPCQPEDVERFVWFKIPAAIINPRCSVRLVDDPAERFAIEHGAI